MLTRRFTFTSDRVGRTDFRIAYETFRGRDPAKIEKAERPLLAEIQRALESVSAPVGDLLEDVDLDLRMRTLRPEGGTITISQRAFDKLASYVEITPFHAGVSVQVEDFLDRWSTADKQE